MVFRALVTSLEMFKKSLQKKHRQILHKRTVIQWMQLDTHRASLSSEVAFSGDVEEGTPGPPFGPFGTLPLAEAFPILSRRTTA